MPRTGTFADLFDKPDDYFGWQRSDLLSLLDRPAGRVLDVGCGIGANVSALHGASHLVGIEIDQAAADRARPLFDNIHVAPVEEVLPHLQPDSFDTIICGDVLEHLSNPWHVLRSLRRCAAQEAQLVISIPNIRNYRTFMNLALRGTFGYERAGLTDITHLRFFTKNDIQASLIETGWSPLEWSHSPGGIVDRLPVRLRGQVLKEFTIPQWYVRARPACM